MSEQLPSETLLRQIRTEVRGNNISMSLETFEALAECAEALRRMSCQCTWTAPGTLTICGRCEMMNKHGGII